MSDLTAILDAMASQIQSELCGTASPEIPNLQVDGRLIPEPSPPTIDVYPGDPFQEPLAMGRGNNQIFLTVRARVSTAENEGGQDLLLAMMDPEADTSVTQAIMSNRTLGGVVEKVATVEGPTAFGVFRDVVGQGRFLGCTWRVMIFP